MDIEKAKNILEGGATCVLCLGESVYRSEKSGISPMLDYLSEGMRFDGYSVADKIVGKAAAMLFVLAGVREVYGEVVSQAALPVFEKHRVECTWGTLTEHIVNRRGDGICPMERTVAELDDPSECFLALIKKREELRKNA